MSLASGPGVDSPVAPCDVTAGSLFVAFDVTFVVATEVVVSMAVFDVAVELVDSLACVELSELETFGARRYGRGSVVGITALESEVRPSHSGDDWNAALRFDALHRASVVDSRGRKGSAAGQQIVACDVVAGAGLSMSGDGVKRRLWSLD